ncbi:MAG TPA: hypothetical protein VL485_07985, partial [Ktedonobacteraceae bacterium]|nr:hypothetical protein [Ktedonobacteraceae bacterium]
MSISDGEKLPCRHESSPEGKMESVISTASGQASSPYALLQGQTPPLQFTGSTFLELLATLSHEFHT